MNEEAHLYRKFLEDEKRFREHCADQLESTRQCLRKYAEGDKLTDMRSLRECWNALSSVRQKIYEKAQGQFAFPLSRWRHGRPEPLDAPPRA